MKLKKFWERVFPKPDYPVSDQEIINLIKIELEKRNLHSVFTSLDLSFGYIRGQIADCMVVYYPYATFYFTVFMNNTVIVYEKSEAEKRIVSSGIDLSLDKDHQMEDSFHCWGIFVDRGHFRIERFRKD